jgi:large repetitive protein
MTLVPMRFGRALLAGLALSLSGCTSLLGDFSYDADGSGGKRGIDSVPAQGDIVVMPVNGLVTSEQGGKATFTIVLAREPASDVFIGLSSSNTDEGEVSPKTLSFSKANFAAPQMVQVTGVDDDEEDGPQTYSILTSPATSEDRSFLGLDPLDPQLTNTDNDTAGVTLTPPDGLVTSEAGGEAHFTVQLNHAPTADVTIPLSTDKPTEGSVSPSSLTFTSVNWMAPQTVTVTGVDDNAKDGPQPYLVVTGNTASDDPKYQGLEVPDAQVINTDNDTAGIILTPSKDLVTFEPNLMTSLTIALSSPPTGKVVVRLSSDDESEGKVSPGTVEFTPENWMAPQLVSITGVDDDRKDGAQPYQVLTAILSSEDPDYLALTPLPKAQVVNVDDDTPDIAVSASPELHTSEDLAAATFSVVLLTKPNGPVKLDVGSSRPDEGVATPPLLTFTEENWAAPQIVTVMGVDDDFADGDQSYVVHVRPNPETADPDYLNLLERDVTLSNIDNDSARVLVEPSKGLVTTESGGTATFAVTLTSKPRAGVTIALSSSDGSEGTVSPNKLTFTPENYKSAQIVTVRGVNDDGQDGDQPYRIITEAPVSDDPEYAKLDVPNVDVLNQDDDSAGITVDPKDKTLVTAENGQTATFTVRLNSRPTADVNLTLTSSNTAEGTVSPGSLKFTANNWNGTQTVTVKGQQDAVHDGAQSYRVSFGPVKSDDKNYGGDPEKLRPLDVKCSNQDDDSPSITLFNIANLTTSEKAGSLPATFQVALGSQPKANVSIGVSSSRTGEATVSPGMLQFTPVNWASPQTVSITGVDEKVQDGPQTLFVLFAPATSDDGDYKNILPNPSNVTVINQDDDSAGILVKAAANLATAEPNGTATFTVELTSQPTADVVIPLASSNKNEGTVSPASLTFTAANWSAPRVVTLTGVDDPVVDGDQSYFISVGPSSSPDPKYNPKTAADVKVQNRDNDTAKVLVSAVNGDTNEAGKTAFFTLALQTQPAADVRVAVVSTRTTEATVSPAFVTFTRANWASPQKVTLTGVNDEMQDGNQLVRIDVGAAQSADPNYDELDPPDVTVTNLDDDTAEIVVTQLSNQTSESGGTATFSVALRTQPSGGATVSLTMTSSKPGEATLSDASLTFTDVDWKAAKLVTVTGVEDDSTADGDQPFTVSFGAAKSADGNYAGKQPLPLSFTNLDNDSPGIIVAPKTGATSEDGDSMTFTVVLQSKPKADVKIPVASSDPDEGTVSTALLTFTSANWSTKQTVKVTGVDDDEHDGSPNYKVTLGKPTSTDDGYAELDPDDVSLTNEDNDIPGIVVSPALGNTTEAGGTTTFSIKLRSKPKASVTIPVQSSDDTEGSLATTKSVVLTTDDWSTPHLVTVHGEDDPEQDGDQPYTIITGPSSCPGDPDYDDQVVDDVELKNIDNDSAAFIITVPAETKTGEAATAPSVTFSVVLTSKPKGPVTLALTSSKPEEGVVTSPESGTLTFTTMSWSTAQSVTVQGVDDQDPDGDVDYFITVGPPQSTDPAYSKLLPQQVSLQNVDDD